MQGVYGNKKVFVAVSVVAYYVINDYTIYLAFFGSKTITSLQDESLLR